MGSAEEIVGAIVIAGFAWWYYTRNQLSLYGADSITPQPVTVNYAISIMTKTERIQTLAHAIAFAEGYEDANGNPVPQNLPYRIKNPADLKWTPSAFMAHVVGKTDSGLLIFDSHESGWEAAYHQVQVMLDGKSNVYDLGDSLLDVAAKYAEGDLNWGRNVAARLGVDVGVTLEEIANG